MIIATVSILIIKKEILKDDEHAQCLKKRTEMEKHSLSSFYQ